MELLIRQYQLWVGIRCPVLEDTRPCPWIPDRWITRIRQTMHQHQIKNCYEAWTIPPLRCHDVFLMEAFEEMGLNTSQLEQLNACCMYLNITTLAEMSDHTGTTLLPQVLTSHPHSSPRGLLDTSTSTLMWPQIHCPSSASWKLWTKTVCNQFTGSNTGTRLTHPLGAWLPTYQKHQYWHWRMAPTDRLLH